MNPKLRKSITLRDSLAFPNSEMTLDAVTFIMFIGIEDFFKYNLSETNNRTYVLIIKNI